MLTLAKEALSIPLVMFMSEAFSVPFLTLIKLCYTKAVEWSSLIPGPEAKSSSEITNPTPFTITYHFQPPTAKLELTMTAAVLPSGQYSPLVLYLCNPTLYEWKWTERKAFARLTVVASNLNQQWGILWQEPISKQEAKLSSEGHLTGAQPCFSSSSC